MITAGASPMASAQTVAAMVAGVSTSFRDAGLADAAGEARALVQGLLAGDDPARRVTDDMPLALALPPGTPDVGSFILQMNAAVARRLSGEPLDRILGWRGFWSLDLRLSPATLSPRPDTETLVSAGLALLRQRPSYQPPARILDLGTGTGAILLALLDDCPGATGLGIDRAPEALVTALANAEQAGLASRAAFRASDWFSAVEGRFDLIVSNPPYIATDAIATLEREVRDHDPHLALDGGKDGLDAYRSIAAGCAAHLAPGGHVIVEAGAGQADDIAAIFAGHNLRCIARHRDLGGHERALVMAGG